MDQLEKFVRQHRDDFDDQNPDPRIWNGIASRLPEPDSRRVALWKYVAVAAVALVLVLSGVIAGLTLNQQDFTDTAEFREFKQTEDYYRTQFDKKWSTISQYQYDPSLEQDIQELTGLYEDLSNELLEGAHPDKQKVLEAMIHNYQTRIDLLERVLTRLSQGEQEKIELSEDEETTKI